MSEARTYRLIGPDGMAFQSAEKGTLGGNAAEKVYGRLSCPMALSFIARGKYVEHRVFFAAEEDAIAAGYRPCGTCLREKYREWKLNQLKP